MGNCFRRSENDLEQERLLEDTNNQTLRTKHNSNIKEAFKILDETNIIPWNDKLEKSCPICLESFEHMDAIYLTNCIHVYHYECLGLWVVNSPICPICRYRL